MPLGLALLVLSTLPVRQELIRIDRTQLTESRRYRAMVDGLEIDGAETVVTTDRAGRIIFRDGTVPEFGRVVRSDRTDAELLERASRAVPQARRDARGLPYGAVKRVFFPSPEHRDPSLTEGAWVFIPTPRESDNWHVAIDAVTGAVLARQNRVFHAALDAQVYAPSPGAIDGGGIGVTPTVPVQLVLQDGGSMLWPDSGVLEGPRLDAWNCCLTEGCAPDAGPRRAFNFYVIPDGGAFEADGGPLDWDAGILLRVDTVVCDKRHLATNDPALHPSGDFVYPPVDGPSPLDPSAPERSDAFAEVHAFFHANQLVEWLEQLSGGSFTLRGARRTPAVPLLVQTNYAEPDTLSDLSFACLFYGVCTWTRFGSVGNAMYVPREQYDYARLPELYPDRDGIYFFQGPTIDFAYDATVVRHELGHAAVQATAGLGFGRTRLEGTWANNETGALHEGLADYLAAAFADDPDIGRYIGPNRDRTVDGPVRTVANALACPDDLEGTIHEDGSILAGALWRGRALLAPGRFDAALYAALVALSGTADFDRVADAVTTMVTLEDASAGAAMRAIFETHGVAGCSHLRAAAGTSFFAPHYGIAGPSIDATYPFGVVPGPYQVRFETTVRGGSIEARADNATGSVRIAVRVGTQVTFAAGAAGLASTADAEVPLGPQGAYVPVPCGEPRPIYVAVSSGSGYPLRLESLRLTLVPDARCPEPTVTLPRLGGNLPAARGCGCDASGGLLPALAALFWLRRRARPERR